MHISKTKNSINKCVGAATQSTAKAYFGVMHKSIKAVGTPSCIIMAVTLVYLGKPNYYLRR